MIDFEKLVSRAIANGHVDEPNPDDCATNDYVRKMSDLEDQLNDVCANVFESGTLDRAEIIIVISTFLASVMVNATNIDGNITALYIDVIKTVHQAIHLLLNQKG